MSENIKCYSFSCLLMSLWCCSLTAWASDALNRYKYNGKELEHTHGIDCLDYGARWYEPVIGRFTTMDPLSEKYYHISPYAYCGNNPVNAIDPDGRDWYIDKDGTYQFNPNVHSQKDLAKNQTYLWQSNNNARSGINYMNDGSILYKNESKAYNRIWNQADKHYRTVDSPNGREVGGFILENGSVLVLPDYANDTNTSKIGEYGYSIHTNGIVSKGSSHYKVVAQIHTHQNRAIDPFPSRYSPDGAYDGKISQKMGTRPVFTMGHDNVVHGIIQNESQQSLFKLPVPFCSLDYLLNGGGMSFSKYVGQNNWKY